MGMTPAQASAPGPGPRQPGARAVIAWFAVALAGSALLGLLAGLIWGEVAPRALLQEVSPGTAEFVNVETSAFIVADGWFCLISAVAGLITGLLGYRFLLAARTGARAAEGVRAAAAAGLILGGIAGAFVMLWLGEQIGLSGYDQHLASSPAGTLFPASLALGAKSALAFWPLVTAVIILVSEWGTRRSAYPSPADSAADSAAVDD
jgi:hypothetical protein